MLNFEAWLAARKLYIEGALGEQPPSDMKYIYWAQLDLINQIYSLFLSGTQENEETPVATVDKGNGCRN